MDRDILSWPVREERAQSARGFRRSDVDHGNPFVAVGNKREVPRHGYAMNVLARKVNGAHANGQHRRYIRHVNQRELGRMLHRTASRGGPRRGHDGEPSL